MKRDGKNISIWQDTVEQPAVKKTAPSKTEVIIIGFIRKLEALRRLVLPDQYTIVNFKK